jgi:hypothetical protein
MSSVTSASPINGFTAAAAVQPKADGASAAGQPGPAPPSARIQVLSSAVATNVARQDGLAPLLADLAAALSSGALPGPVAQAAESVLGAVLPLDPPPDAEALSAAAARSGLFLEADLATTGGPAASDMKAALLGLQSALEAAGASPSSAATTSALVPPTPSGALQAQPAALPSLVADLEAAALLPLLARRTAAGLSRQLLLQAGSVRSRSGTQPGAAQWLFELPVESGEDASMAAFEVERDGRRRAGVAETPLWRARFALEVGDLGPVHAQLSLQGDTVRVALWAEQPSTLADLQARQDDLAAGLQAERLEPQLLIQSGRPPVAAPGRGALLDQAV